MLRGASCRRTWRGFRRRSGWVLVICVRPSAGRARARSARLIRLQLLRLDDPIHTDVLGPSFVSARACGLGSGLVPVGSPRNPVARHFFPGKVQASLSMTLEFIALSAT